MNYVPPAAENYYHKSRLFLRKKSVRGWGIGLKRAYLRMVAQITKLGEVTGEACFPTRVLRPAQ
jgi:hypothetical protein